MANTSLGDICHSIGSFVRAAALAMVAALPSVLWSSPGDPLCFTSEQDGSTLELDVINKLRYYGFDSIEHLEYREGDSGDWQQFVSGRTFTLNKGDKMYLRSSLEVYNDISHGENNYSYFSIEGRMAVSGDLTTLLAKNGSDSVGSGAFYRLFVYCPITTAPELPATSLDYGCYSRMFMYCSQLTEPPELPAMQLAEECYESMFYDSGLIRAPELPATKLASACYMRMLEGCKFSEPPVLPAPILEVGCYQEMFRRCHNLVRAPQLPVMDLVGSCYSSMFSECTALTEAPELSATVMAPWCYHFMFWGCTGLEQAPELPALTLADSCYQQMFLGCTSLTAAPVLPGTNIVRRCYAEMFRNCEKLTRVPELPETKLAEACYNGMFWGCTSLTEPPELPATELAENCYQWMFYECKALKEAPILPAVSLTNHCYSQMFEGCSSLQKVTLLATQTEDGGFCLGDWLKSVAAHGTVRCPAALDLPSGSASGVPEGWTRKLPSEPYDEFPDDPDPVNPDPVGPDPVNPEPTPSGDTEVAVVDAAEIVAGVTVAKIATLGGVWLDGAGKVAGSVELKLAKANKKTGLSKVTGSVTMLGGKKVTLKAAEKNGYAFGDGPQTVTLVGKGVSLTVKLGADAAGNVVFTGADGADGVVTSASLGGAMANQSGLAAYLDPSFTLGVEGEILSRDGVSFIPDGEPITIKGTKWTFSKAAAVTFAKAKGSKDKTKVLQGYDDPKKPNVSGLKLTYTAKNGTFKGSFKVYALQGAAGKEKLKKYTVNVTGVVVEGKGFGTATCKRPAAGPFDFQVK